MKIIRISQEVYDGLKSISTFEDTPDSIIRRLLAHYGMPLLNGQQERTPIKRVQRGKITPQDTYEKWLLYTLWRDYKGSARANEVTETIVNKMTNKGILTDIDFEEVSTGQSRAANTIAWGRNRLKKNGLLRRDSPRGIWELSKAGESEASVIAL